MNDRRLFDPAHDGPLISAYADGELQGDDRALVAWWVENDVRARQELDRVVNLKAFTDHLQLREAPREAWEDFHSKVYNRSERSLGWMLVLIGAAVVGGYLVLRVAVALLMAAIPLVVRLGGLAVGAGLLLLLISALRQRLFSRKRDRYDDVVR